MLIKALCDYADLRQGSSDDEAIPDGWCKQDCSYRIMLDEDGNIEYIEDIRRNQKYFDKKGKEKTKLVPRKVILPERVIRTSGANSNTLEHTSKYIFGLELVKGELVATEKGEKVHKAFVEHETKFFDELDSDVCVAYRRFAEKWNPQNETENPHLKKLGKEYTANFCFGLADFEEYLEEDEDFADKYNKQYAQSKNIDSSTDVLPVCGVTGVKAPVARLHDKIKLPGGQASGCALVCVNSTAYESYGQVQSLGSNISESAMKKYTVTLNDLIADKGHRVLIDDLVIVFFGMSANDNNECKVLSMALGNGTLADDTENNLASFMQKVRSGRTGDTSFFGKLDKNVTFYIAGMTPNSSRICQKFIYRNRFGTLLENIIMHQNDMRINPDSEREVSFYSIKRELISPNSTKEKVPPPLMTSIVLSALNGTNYPDGLLETVVRRVKTDSDNSGDEGGKKSNRFIKINDVRVGIIKACLNRKCRNAGKKEEIKMALDTNNNDAAYLCGRLFAIYEKIQLDSLGGGVKLNRTIKDAYFSSACVRPSTVMPKLDKLAQNHMRKLSDSSGIFYSKLLGEIYNGFENGLPQILDLDAQGRFIIGYYQQNSNMYKKNEQVK